MVERNGGWDEEAPQGKKQHKGVGGKSSKSNNHKECKNANIRRNAKNEREENKKSAQAE